MSFVTLSFVIFAMSPLIPSNARQTPSSFPSLLHRLADWRRPRHHTLSSRTFAHTDRDASVRFCHSTCHLPQPKTNYWHNEPSESGLRASPLLYCMSKHSGRRLRSQVSGELFITVHSSYLDLGHCWCQNSAEPRIAPIVLKKKRLHRWWILTIGWIHT